MPRKFGNRWAEYRGPIDLMDRPVDLQFYGTFDNTFRNNSGITFCDIYCRLRCSWVTSGDEKVLDALDASVPPGSSALVAVEQLFSGQKIRNIIACEGSARVERHERMASWNRRFLSAGFRSSPLSSRAISQARLLLSLYFHCGYTLNSDHYSIVLGWKNMPLLGAAAWKSS